MDQGNFLQVYTDSFTNTDKTFFNMRCDNFVFWSIMIQLLMSYIIQYDFYSELNRFWSSFAQRLGGRFVQQLRREHVRIINEEPPYYIQKLSVPTMYLTLLASLKQFFIFIDLSQFIVSDWVLVQIILQYILVFQHFRFMFVTMRI